MLNREWFTQPCVEGTEESVIEHQPLRCMKINIVTEEK